MTLQQAIKGISNHIWSSEKEVGEFLVSLSDLTKSKSFIEVGTFKGLTSCYLIDYFKRINGKFYSIDITDYRDESVKKYFEENKDAAKFINNDSLKELKNFEKGSIDIIFLDSYHTLEQVRAEFTLSTEILKPNGYICIHDYFNSEVHLLVDYLREEQFKGNLQGFQIINLDTPEHRGLTVIKSTYAK